MSERRHYSKAPITEAVINLQVNLPSEATLAGIENLFASISTDYPNREAEIIVESQVTAGASVGATAHQTHVGYLYSTPNRKQIFNPRMYGFSFSQLAPYERWELFRDEAKRLWNIYQDAMKPTAVTRVGVRYINRLDIPLPIRDFKDFLRTIPEVSPDLPQALSGFFMQLQIPQEDIQAMVMINQAMISPPSPDVVSVLLDIDAYREQILPAEQTVFWECLETLHTKLDQVFEGCITDETRELIK
jgi:uncharacterized protein (TIGR04255 family)